MARAIGGLRSALRGVVWQEGGAGGLRGSPPAQARTSESGTTDRPGRPTPGASPRGRSAAGDVHGPGPVLRSWWGATAAEDAEAYGRYLALTGMMAFRRAPGCRGGWTLRRVNGDRADFLVLSLWDSLDAVRGFAGEDTERAVFYPEDERYLVARDERVEHWDVVQGGTFEGAPTGYRETEAAHPG